MPVEGRGPELGAVRKGGRDLTTDGSLRGSAGSVRKLQNVLHAKAKEEPDRRFHALVDKVWRQDFLLEAWRMVRRNGGAAGVDGVTVADVEAYGVERWVGELSRDLRDGGYEPSPVRQVLIPKKQPGKFRPLGIPCLRDRVAQTSAMLVLGPIFEADLQPEQYAYRPGRSAKDAVQRIRGLLYRGHNEVVDADLSNYFGEIPHAELMKSIARRVSDGRMLGLIKAWLEMPVMRSTSRRSSSTPSRSRPCGGRSKSWRGRSRGSAGKRHTWPGTTGRSPRRCAGAGADAPAGARAGSWSEPLVVPGSGVGRRSRSGLRFSTLAGQVGGPVVHEPAPALEQVRAPIRRLDLVPDHVR